MRGDITVDGHPKDAATFARVSGYVEQVQKPSSHLEGNDEMALTW